MPQTLICNFLYLFNPKHLIFYNINSLRSNKPRVHYKRFTPRSYQDIGIKNNKNKNNNNKNNDNNDNNDDSNDNNEDNNDNNNDNIDDNNVNNDDNNNNDDDNDNNDNNDDDKKTTDNGDNDRKVTNDKTMQKGTENQNKRDSKSFTIITEKESKNSNPETRETYVHLSKTQVRPRLYNKVGYSHCAPMYGK